MYITKLFMFETNEQHAQYNRPYQARVDGDIIQSLNRDTMDGLCLDSSTLAPYAGLILRPSTHVQNEVLIKNDWDTVRLAFMMEVEHESIGRMRNIQVLTGYTDFAGFTSRGAIDHNMVFYINNTITIRESDRILPNGRRETVATVQDSSQLLTGTWVPPSSTGSSSNIHTMTPYDVYGNIALDSVINVNTMDRRNRDLKIIDSRNTLADGPRLSRRVNNNSTEWLSRSLSAYTGALNSAKITEESFNRVIGRARSQLREGTIDNNSTLKTLTDYTSFSEYQSVTFSELLQFNGRLEDEAVIVTRDEMVREINVEDNYLRMDPLNTESMISTTNETIAAQIIANYVPAFMTSTVLTRLDFFATNDVRSDYHEDTLVQVKRMSSFTNALDRDTQEQAIAFKIRSELMPALTNNDSMLVSVSASFNLFYENRISVTIGDGPTISYCIPAFSDNMSSPIITTDEHSVSEVSRDINNILNSINLERAR